MRKCFILFVLLFFSKVTVPQSSWFKLNSGTEAWLFSVDFVDENTGFVCGDGGTILKTTNAGANWIICSSPLLDNLKSIFTVDLNCIYTVGNGGSIMKSTNVGQSWFILNSGTNESLTSCFFLNKDTGFAVGYNRTILRTLNGGINWTQIVSSTENSNLQSTFWINYQIGFVTDIFSIYQGYASNILRTTNSGYNWYTVATTGMGLWDIAFVDTVTGIVVGDQIGLSNNLGQNWSFFSSGFVWASLQSVFFCNNITGYAVGVPRDATWGYILKTTNRGYSWVRNIVPYNDWFYSDVSFTSLNTGYVVGWFGAILKTTNGGDPSGIETQGNVVPDNFSLSQNYPNPFNPSTKIKFDIPPLRGARGVTARLSIYDALGREIAMLVNEQLNPGTYEVSWDGSKYPSGVYFYKLIAGDYIETKKMILMK